MDEVRERAHSHVTTSVSYMRMVRAQGEYRRNPRRKHKVQRLALLNDSVEGSL